MKSMPVFFGEFRVSGREVGIAYARGKRHSNAGARRMARERHSVRFKKMKRD